MTFWVMFTNCIYRSLKLWNRQLLNWWYYLHCYLVLYHILMEIHAKKKKKSYMQKTPSPHPKGLFQRAIMQSGTSVNPFSVAVGLRQATLTLGASLGCQGDAGSEEFLRCLQRTDAQDLAAGFQNFFVSFVLFFNCFFLLGHIGIKKWDCNTFTYLGFIMVKWRYKVIMATMR